jgi:hypothetical protein
MTMLAGLAALATAMCVGYHLGRRAATTRPTWKRRTSRVALGRLVIGLLVLMTARRLRRRTLPAATGLWGPRLVAPVALLRGSVARMWSY